MKKCSKCGVDKASTEFHISRARPDGLQSYCIPCITVIKRHEYSKHRDRYLAKAKRNAGKRSVENRTRVVEYLKTHPCVDCGESDFVVLTFDHVSGEKLGTISQLAGSDCSWIRIESEISKCVVRCANCHMRKTAEQLGWYKYL